MLTLTFFAALIMLALAVMLTPLGGWTKPAVWLALSLLLSLLVALKVVVLRALVPLALLGTLALLAGCAWQQGVKVTIDSISAGAETTHVGVVSYYNPKCEALAFECGDKAKAAPSSQPAPPCPLLADCLADKHRWNVALKAIQATCIGGYGALAIAAKEKALEYATEGGRQLADLIAALKKAKVLP